MQLLAKLNNCIKNVRYRLYPHHCLLCGCASENIDLCSACYAELPWITCSCERCAAPLPESAASCGACLQRPPPWDASLIPFRYQAPLDRLILSLKFQRRLAVAPTLGRLIADTVRARDGVLPDALLPVPMHARRLRERGFNQAHELARVLGQELQLPLLQAGVRRVRHTEMQSRLDGKARRSNLRGAFALDESLLANAGLPGHVAIIDDVVTTGSTVAELTHTLRQAGVQRVEVWACAKAGL